MAPEASPDSKNFTGLPPSMEYVADVAAWGISPPGIRENHMSDVPTVEVTLRSVAFQQWQSTHH